MRRREFYIISGLIMFLCMGTIYSWSVFQKPLIEALFDKYGVVVSSTMAVMPYTIFLVSYSFSMPIAGRFIKKINPKYISMFGAILVGLGWILASYSRSIEFTIVTYGLLGGIGVGTIYGVPMAVVGEWFPEKKGFAIGLTLLGFGLSPFITAPIANRLIQNIGVFNAFRILGITFIIVLSLLSLLLKFPENKSKNSNIEIKNDLEPKEMLKTKSFYALWFSFVIGTFTGLMMIGLSSVYAQEVIALSPSQSALCTSFFAIFNGLGRPIFGALTDKLGSKKTILISYSLIIISASLSLLLDKNIYIFIITFAIFWFNLGGWLAIAPASTNKLFGAKNYAVNFGILFTAYGIGAIMQGLISGFIKEQYGTYEYVFYPVIFLCLIALLISQTYLGVKKNKDIKNINCSKSI